MTVSRWHALQSHPPRPITLNTEQNLDLPTCCPSTTVPAGCLWLVCWCHPLYIKALPLPSGPQEHERTCNTRPSSQQNLLLRRPGRVERNAADIFYIFPQTIGCSVEFWSKRFSSVDYSPKNYRQCQLYLLLLIGVTRDGSLNGSDSPRKREGPR